ncbi:hypothetical protein NEIPOLOT_01552 [Neisseria polysaccharea ATCC 43768]|nr:hypothetical protein NEIPOLOT_01552 [Neisseria polysaccharea ATCC 43768]
MRRNNIRNRTMPSEAFRRHFLCHFSTRKAIGNYRQFKKYAIS